MAKRDQRYKIPRNWIVVPLIVYTLVFAVICIVITATVQIIASYGAAVKADAEIEKTRDMALLYEQAYSDDAEENPQKRLDKVFDMYKELGYDVVVSDFDANIIYSAGENTIRLSKVEEFEEERKELSDELSDFIFQEEIINQSEELYKNVVENVVFFPDEKTMYVDVDQYNIQVDVSDMFKNDEFVKNIQKNSAVIPYWTGFKVRDNTQVIAFKTNLIYKTNDFIYIVFYATMAYLIAVIIFVILIVNIVRTHRNNRKMRRIVFSDNITGNRNWFWFAYKSKELIRKRKADTRYALVSLSFVRYRNFVLCHSLDVGEHTLKMIWQTIEGSLDKKEICAHAGTASFPMLIKVTDEAHAREKLMKIIKRLETIGGDHDFKFQAGVYMVDPKIRKKADIDILYNNASSARATLEDSDDTGIAFFGDKLVEDEKWIDTVTERQREAIQKEEFKIYYQPKYDPRTDELMGAEALIRWNSPDLGFVSPGRFIPIFEKSGFITEIDHYMVSHVAQDQKAWLDAGMKCVPVSVNISRAHFSEINLAEQIRDMVDKTGTPHDLIEIELTESAFFDDQKQMLATIRKLKEYGFLVSMDDFGSGYSSLNSLKDMPLDILKLDAGFFKGEADNSRAEIVVSEAIRLAKKLNMQTVAEGVEDQAQVDFLASEGCNMIQGYFYAKPMPKEEYEQRISSEAQQTASEAVSEAQEAGVVMPEAGVETPASTVETQASTVETPAAAQAEEGAPIDTATESTPADNATAISPVDAAPESSTVDAAPENSPVDVPPVE